ncbi:hypothetical protein DL93DRAFT_2166528 [Clavulina sp. PMI_390]|nr:hypothetical protein DL93DRAFT_2166528 [Clavulina sp. PMI_390]
MATTNTLAGHRILIASLFLPNTVDLSPHNSAVATPMLLAVPPPKKPAETLPSISSLPVPKKKLASILEDLADKASQGTPTATPKNDPVQNPLAAIFPSVAASKPPLSRTVSGTHNTRVPTLPRTPFGSSALSPPTRASADSNAAVDAQDDAASFEIPPLQLPSSATGADTPTSLAMTPSASASSLPTASVIGSNSSNTDSHSPPSSVASLTPSSGSTTTERHGRSPGLSATMAPSLSSSSSTAGGAAGLGRRQSRTSRSGVRRSNSTISTGNDSRQYSLGTIHPWEIVSSGHGNVGLHKALASVKDEVPDVKWIGVLDTPTDEFADDLRKDIDLRLGAEGNIPVWVHDSDFHSAYDVFCHQVLWPTLHYVVPDAPKTKVVYESSSFVQYKKVNEQFADSIVANYKEGDIVWINDYHLCLVPQLVRQKLPNAPIGFFMHVAWPSTEIFRCLAVREQLLYGLLGSDLLGFQTHNYARHFRQTCSRILGLEALPKGIQLQLPDRGPGHGRSHGDEGKEGGLLAAGLAHGFVDVAVFPIGLDIQDLTKKRHEPEVREWATSIRQRYEGKLLIVGRDKLDEVSGVKHKVIAFETFLERHPEFQGRVVLIQVALARTEQNELQASITDVISHVNSRFGSLTYQPVVLLHTQDITFPMYLGLLSAADAFMVTSLREGMALRTHEFVECQHERKRPLILSEFTGSYSYSGFRSCISINPWDYRKTADAIHYALTMSEDEADSRWHDLHSHVITQTAQSFVTTFLTRCVRVQKEHARQNPSKITNLPLDETILPAIQEIALAPPSTPTLTGDTTSTKTKKVLTLVDFEGTIWSEDPRVVREHGFVVPERVIKVLRGLVAESWNEVWLLSGLPVKKLETIADQVPNLGLVAENGCFLKDTNSTKWTSMVSNIDFSWKPLCLEILAYFTERTPGSFVEDRDASIIWRFITGPTEPDEPSRQWARRQAAEAQNHIWDSLGERFALRIIPGARSFLVLPKNVSRSTAVGVVFSKAAHGGSIESYSGSLNASSSSRNGLSAGADQATMQDHQHQLMASLSAQTFWNPTGAIPRPRSPTLSHLHPATVVPSASFGAGTTGLGTPMPGRGAAPGTPTGAPATLTEEETDYVHVGYPKSVTSASASAPSVPSVSGESVSGVESLSESMLESEVGSDAAAVLTSEPSEISGASAAVAHSAVIGTALPQDSLAVGTSLPNSQGVIPGFAPNSTTPMHQSGSQRLSSSGFMLPNTASLVGGSRGIQPSIPQKSEFGLVLALTGDEPLIRRLSGLKESQTCTTSGKGSDAKWRLDSGEEVLKALEKVASLQVQA